MFLRSPRGTSEAVLEVDDVDELVDGDALAGEGGLLYLEAGTVEYAAVGGNGVARLKVDYVAHHELGAGHDAELAVAHDLAGGGGHGLQGLYGLFRLVFLIDAEHGVDYDDGHDDDDICKALALGAKDAGYGAYRRGGYEDDYHRVGHLREEALYERVLLLSGQLVPAVALQPLCGLAGAQALFAAAYLAQYAFGVLAIVLQHYHPFIT